MTQQPDDAAIERMLHSAAEESWRNSGGPEELEHTAALRERSRRMANLSIRFDMVASLFYLLLVIIVGIVFFSVV